MDDVLPIELWNLIMEELDVKSIICFNQTCRLAHQILSSAVNKFNDIRNNIQLALFHGNLKMIDYLLHKNHLNLCKDQDLYTEYLNTAYERNDLASVNIIFAFLIERLTMSMDIPDLYIEGHVFNCQNGHRLMNTIVENGDKVAFVNYQNNKAKLDDLRSIYDSHHPMNEYVFSPNYPPISLLYIAIQKGKLDIADILQEMVRKDNNGKILMLTKDHLLTYVRVLLNRSNIKSLKYFIKIVRENDVICKTNIYSTICAYISESFDPNDYDNEDFVAGIVQIFGLLDDEKS